MSGSRGDTPLLGHKPGQKRKKKQTHVANDETNVYVTRKYHIVRGGKHASKSAGKRKAHLSTHPLKKGVHAITPASTPSATSVGAFGGPAGKKKACVSTPPVRRGVHIGTPASTPFAKSVDTPAGSFGGHSYSGGHGRALSSNFVGTSEPMANMERGYPHGLSRQQLYAITDENGVEEDFDGEDEDSDNDSEDDTLYNQRGSGFADAPNETPNGKS